MSPPAEQQPTGAAAMRIEGTIAHAGAKPANIASSFQSRIEHGEKISRQVVGVGVIAPGERHSYSFSVDVIPARPGRTVSRDPSANKSDQAARLRSISMNRRNSARVLASLRNAPSILLVTIDTPSLWTPRVVMH